MTLWFVGLLKNIQNFYKFRTTKQRSNWPATRNAARNNWRGRRRPLLRARSILICSNTARWYAATCTFSRYIGDSDCFFSFSMLIWYAHRFSPGSIYRSRGHIQNIHMKIDTTTAKATGKQLCFTQKRTATCHSCDGWSASNGSQCARDITLLRLFFALLNAGRFFFGRDTPVRAKMAKQRYDIWVVLLLEELYRPFDRLIFRDSFSMRNKYFFWLHTSSRAFYAIFDFILLIITSRTPSWLFRWLLIFTKRQMRFLLISAYLFRRAHLAYRRLPWRFSLCVSINYPQNIQINCNHLSKSKTIYHFST